MRRFAPGVFVSVRPVESIFSAGQHNGVSSSTLTDFCFCFFSSHHPLICLCTHSLTHSQGWIPFFFFFWPSDSINTIYCKHLDDKKKKKNTFQPFQPLICHSRSKCPHTVAQCLFSSRGAAAVPSVLPALREHCRQKTQKKKKKRTHIETRKKNQTPVYHPRRAGPIGGLVGSIPHGDTPTCYRDRVFVVAAPKREHKLELMKLSSLFQR